MDEYIDYHLKGHGDWKQIQNRQQPKKHKELTQFVINAVLGYDPTLVRRFRHCGNPFYRGW